MHSPRAIISIFCFWPSFSGHALSTTQFFLTKFVRRFVPVLNRPAVAALLNSDVVARNVAQRSSPIMDGAP